MLMKLIQKHKKIKRKKEAPKKRNNEARKENRKQVIIFINYESTKIAEASRTEAPKPKLAVRDSSNDSIFETWYTGSITKEKATLKKSKTEETPEVKIFNGLYPSLRIKDEPKLKVIDPWTIDEII